MLAVISAFALFNYLVGTQKAVLTLNEYTEHVRLILHGRNLAVRQLSSSHDIVQDVEAGRTTLVFPVH